jgi:hypothetical protein
MKTWDQFYPYILTDVIGCPFPLVDNALCLAAREFCQDTSAIREWSDEVTADGISPVFDFDISTSQELVKVMKAIVNDVGYDVISYKELPEDWQNASPGSIGNKVVQLDLLQYRVFPAPVAGDVIALQIATCPTIRATSCADDLVTRYADDIANGAKARLMTTKGNAWSDVALGAHFKTLFATSKNSAANEDIKQRSHIRVTKSIL